MPSNVSVRSLNGQSINFIVDFKKDKVKDLLNQYSEKFGMKAQELQLVYGGKLLGNKLQTLLTDIGIEDNSTLYAVIKLKGGKTLKVIIQTVDSKIHNIEIDDDKTCYQLKQYIHEKLCQSLSVQSMALQYAGVQLDNSKKLSSYKIVEHGEVLKILQTKCSLGKIAGIILAYETDPYGIDEQTVRMPCGHVIGRDGMTGFIRSLIDNYQFVIRCPAFKPNGGDCRCEWDFSVCRKIGVFTAQQKKYFEEGLSKNWINRNTSECPNCKFRVMKGDLKSNRVVCPKCKYGDYCFSCSRKWGTNNMKFCGNPKCGGLSGVLSSAEWTIPFNLIIDQKTKEKKTFMLPTIRMCPNTQCHALINHNQGCKHIDCCPNCKTVFCYVCLSIKKGKQSWKCGAAYDYCGMIAQTQQI